MTFEIRYGHNRRVDERQPGGCPESEVCGENLAVVPPGRANLLITGEFGQPSEWRNRGAQNLRETTEINSD